jgi:hypothetical protein
MWPLLLTLPKPPKLPTVLLTEQNHGLQCLYPESKKQLYKPRSRASALSNPRATSMRNSNTKHARIIAESTPSFHPQVRNRQNALFRRWPKSQKADPSD